MPKNKQTSVFYEVANTKTDNFSSFVFDTKEEFLAAPIFDGKTIEEIADQITDYDVCLEPGAYE